MTTKHKVSAASGTDESEPHRGTWRPERVISTILSFELPLSGYDPGETFMGTCPDCKAQLEFAEGCMKCHICGFSECG